MTGAEMEHQLLSLVRRTLGDTRADSDLLARLRDDHAAFAELVSRHGPLVWGVCRHLLGEADAEDAFQATFVALLRSAVRDGAVLAAWLHGVAFRVSLAARREAGRRRTRERAAAAPEAIQTHRPDDWADTMEAVHREVAGLPEADRAAFVLCVLEGLTQAETAARLGRTPGTVAGQVARAKKRLVARLTRRGVVPGLAALGTASIAGAVPPGLAERVLALPGASLSPAVLRLAKGASGMTALSTKLMAAALLVGAVLVTGVLSATTEPINPQPVDIPVTGTAPIRTGDKGGAPVEKQPDAELIQGTWRVVKTESPDEKREKWVEAAKKSDDTYTFTAKKVVWSGENSYGSYHLLLNEEKKTIEMRSENIRGIADVRVGVYRLDGDKVTICWGEDRKLPNDFTPKAPAAQLCHLERVIALADVAGQWQSAGGEERVTLDLRAGGAYVLERRALVRGSVKLPYVETVSSGKWEFKDDRVQFREEKYVTDGQAAAVRDRIEAFTAVRKGRGVVLVGDKGTELLRVEDAAGLMKKLQGEWMSNRDCLGDITFNADGTYSWIHYGPGDATVVGKWSMRWEALPPTLVMTSTASNDKDYIGQTKELKLLQLDGKTLVWQNQDAGKIEFTREARPQSKKQQDAKVIQGRWKVVNDEYLADQKWVDAAVPTDFVFVFSADEVTVTRQKTSLICTLKMNPDERTMNLVRAAGGVDKLEQCIYQLYGLDQNGLIICVVGGHLLPADTASKAATVRLYHLERVVEPKK
jgi:RNA polymerase sigma factor (sigma-70 family)